VSRALLVILGIGAALALMLVSRRASAGEIIYDEYGEPIGEIYPAEPEYLPEEIAMSAEQNISAFLAMIRAAEGTDPNPYGMDPYTITYGYQHVIQSFADHPTNLGEWGPVSGPSGPTSAAGAYQIVQTTWNSVILSRLGDIGFSPGAQDRAAQELLRVRGALADVRAGRFTQAINKLGKEWASLPSATVNQPRITLDKASQIYADAGGAFA